MTDQFQREWLAKNALVNDERDELAKVSPSNAGKGAQKASSKARCDPQASRKQENIGT